TLSLGDRSEHGGGGPGADGHLCCRSGRRRTGMTRRGRSAWTAPSEDGGYLVDPPWPDLATYAQGNAQQRLQQSAASFAGSPWGTFHQRARRELVTLAARYSSTYVPNLPADDQVPLFVTGHQP